eukprot:scaffold204607_cov53-Cyclotella_meneghiniana.AAC.2
MDLNIQTIAASMQSQCLTVDMLNGVKWSGLEYSASKRLHWLDFECWDRGEKFSCGLPTEQGRVSD